MSATAELVSIAYKPQHVDFTPPDRFMRTPVDQARLVVDYGIEGDRKGGNPKRQINIMSAETLADLAASGYKTAPGEMGEQIVIRGVVVEDLEPGTQLQIGDGVVVEVLELRRGCKRFEAIQDERTADFAGRLGVLVKVVRGGSIRKSDSVRVLKADEVYV